MELFTVLIAEKEHIDAILQENKLFFEPFLDNKELAFCYWNPEGQNLHDSVPGLLDAVGRQKEWRAVIVNNGQGDAIKKQNPFDTVDYHAIQSLAVPSQQPKSDETWDEWESSWNTYYKTLTQEKETIYRNALKYPLQKLTTWLCFRPEDYILNDVKEKQDVNDWAMEIISKDDRKSSVKLELLERDMYKSEMRMKEQIRRAFVADEYLSVSYPAEIYCISIRTADNGFFDPDPYWNVHQENEYSSFADRNMYFDKMRFMVFDLLPRTHRNFRNDYIRFLASILIFISNPVPCSAMKARRLYQLDVENDDTPLCTLITSYDRKLAATYDVIENEMEKIRSEIPGELTDKAAKAMFCSPKDIPVLLDDSCDPEKAIADKDYGLFFNHPENEYHKWNRDYNTSKKALDYIVNQQARSVRKGVNELQFFSEISDVNISRLTPFQINDIRDYTDSAENEMVDSIPSDLTNTSQYTDRLSEAAENVKKNISQRMTRKTTVILSLVCLGLYLICFFPFLFANGNTPKTITTAIGLCGIMLGVLAIIMLVSLFFLRSAVKNAVRDYNNTVRDILNEINFSLKQVSKYLSASCNVRRGHAVQNYAEKNLDEYTKSLRIRRKHQEDIRKRRAFLAEGYQDYIGDKSFCDDTMIRPYDYDFEQTVEYTYPAPFLAGDCRQIEFISCGNYVTVPSSYITRILVKMEEIYEK